ncbi:nickel/cobalt transporter [Scandinavium lactucae]|uniref:Nickel/cobalt efflux system n=1 Tax=Scandinavium lactucae TaxID=3095028 RepID=A0ABU4QWF1_9ENTR|nr:MULTISPECIES: nickel/cobalt transporter [unclassified Scandinavium]MDX6041595.1 nickel/cobalt transporter [Scandinavium sp. V105_6]MDX6049516.1 nickel/cobalt transporter [Scandinavium sp. V105_1]
MIPSVVKRDWRIPATLAFVALLLAFAFQLHAHWATFLQWCLATQITLHRYLVMYLLQLNNHQYSAGVWLLVGAFMYGVLHAIGPGHGKFIVTTYLSTHRESQLAARIVPFLGSLMQGISAILFVFILAVGMNLASGDLSESRWYIEKISAVLIGSFGALVIWQALKSLKPKAFGFSRLTPQDASGHQHAADCGCGHHGVRADIAQADWKTRVGIVLAIGARPCSGAIMIMLFSNALGIVSWGIIAVMAMAFGTALSILGLSLAVRYARERAVAWFGEDSSQLHRLVPVVKIIGGVLIILFALVLFMTVIPISANGDYIAAGC